MISVNVEHRQSFNGLPLKSSEAEDLTDSPLDTATEKTISDEPYNPVLNTPLDDEKPLVPVDEIVDYVEEDIIDDKSTTLNTAMIQEDLDNEVEALTKECDGKKQADKLEDDIIIKANPPMKMKTRSIVGRIFSALMFLIMTLLLIVFVLGVIMLETNLSLPIVSQLRSLPEVSSFRHNHYNPLRAQLVQYFAGIRAKLTR